jgi:hypothetical protein
MIDAQETRDGRSPANTALLALRIIPGLLLMEHGLQIEVWSRGRRSS